MTPYEDTATILERLARGLREWVRPDADYDAEFPVYAQLKALLDQHYGAWRWRYVYCRFGHNEAVRDYRTAQLRDLEAQIQATWAEQPALTGEEG